MKPTIFSVYSRHTSTEHNYWRDKEKKWTKEMMNSTEISDQSVS